MLPYFTERFGNAASRTPHVRLGRPTTPSSRRASRWRRCRREREARSSSRAARPSRTTSPSRASSRAPAAARKPHRHRRHRAQGRPRHVQAPRARGLPRHRALPSIATGRVDLDAAARRDHRPHRARVRDGREQRDRRACSRSREIGAIARERGVLLHTDAAQAVGKVPFDVGAAASTCSRSPRTRCTDRRASARCTSASGARLRAGRRCSTAAATNGAALRHAQRPGHRRVRQVRRR